MRLCAGMLCAGMLRCVASAETCAVSCVIVCSAIMYVFHVCVCVRMYLPLFEIHLLGDAPLENVL